MSVYRLAAVVRQYAEVTDDYRLRSGNLNGKVNNRLKKAAERLHLAAAATVYRVR